MSAILEYQQQLLAPAAYGHGGSGAAARRSSSNQLSPYLFSSAKISRGLPLATKGATAMSS